jgi:GT2 family glycosyltransferase
VVDNGSSDGTAEMVESRYPEVRLLRLPVNRGFGAAVNAGARSSEAEWIALLNNDVVADDAFVERLTQICEGRQAEMIAACMRRPDGRVDTLGVVLDQSLVPYDLAHGQAYSTVLAAAPVPLAPSGGAAAFRRAAFLEVGGFDEGFFAYLEDADLGIRMRMAGMRCATAYEAFGWHEHAGTLGRGSAEKNRLIAQGRVRLLRKYGANLGVADRARGALIDTAVYAGRRRPQPRQRHGQGGGEEGPRSAPASEGRLRPGAAPAARLPRGPAPEACPAA